MYFEKKKKKVIFTIWKDLVFFFFTDDCKNH